MPPSPPPSPVRRSQEAVIVVLASAAGHKIISHPPTIVNTGHSQTQQPGPVGIFPEYINNRIKIRYIFFGLAHPLLKPVGPNASKLSK